METSVCVAPPGGLSVCLRLWARPPAEGVGSRWSGIRKSFFALLQLGAVVGTVLEQTGWHRSVEYARLPLAPGVTLVGKDLCTGGTLSSQRARG